MQECTEAEVAPTIKAADLKDLTPLHHVTGAQLGNTSPFQTPPSHQFTWHGGSPG
jgi:hypothetical protein